MEKIIQGDCLEVLKTYPDNHFTSVITDPPYMINFMSKEFDKFKDNPAANIDLWKEVLRVSKPGATLLAFGGDRTHHHLMVALENAGWQIKTCLYWIFGSGFPKSTNVSKQIEKVDYYRAKEWQGYGTALKPAAEIIVMAIKKNDGTYASNTLKWGVSGINIDKSKIGEQCRFPANIILEKSYIPILTLMDNIDIIRAQLIEEYYGNYEVPSVWKRVQDVSEQNEERKKEILQSPMLQQSSKELSKSNGGEEAHKEINRIDEEEPDNKERERESELQGTLVQQRIPLHKHAGTNERSINNCQTNDEQSRNSRTSINNGDESKPPINSKRDSSPSEWNKGRQSNREFRDNKQHQSHQNTSQIDRREQALEVLIRDVPKAWLRYFRYSGYSIIDPECTASMLDEQTGVLKTGAMKPVLSSGKNDIYGKR